MVPGLTSLSASHVQKSSLKTLNPSQPECQAMCLRSMSEAICSSPSPFIYLRDKGDSVPHPPHLECQAMCSSLRLISEAMCVSKAGVSTHVTSLHTRASAGSKQAGEYPCHLTAYISSSRQQAGRLTPNISQSNTERVRNNTERVRVKACCKSARG